MDWSQLAEYPTPRMVRQQRAQFPRFRKARAGVWWLASVASFVGVAGCGPRPVKDVSNPDPSGKIPAIELAANNRNWRAVPQMVKDLESDDPAIRFYAIEGLRRITGQTFAYHYYEDESQRQPAVEHWKQWLASQHY
jgi:hypothetical protein